MQQFVCIYRPTTWRGTQVRTIRLVGCRKRRDQRRQLLVIVMSLNRAFLCVVAGGSTSSEHHTCLHTSAPPSFLAPDDRLLKKIATHPSQMNGVKPKTFKKRQIPNTRSISAKTNYLRLVVIYTRTYISSHFHFQLWETIGATSSISISDAEYVCSPGFRGVRCLEKAKRKQAGTNHQPHHVLAPVTSCRLPWCC